MFPRNFSLEDTDLGEANSVLGEKKKFGASKGKSHRSFKMSRENYD